MAVTNGFLVFLARSDEVIPFSLDQEVPQQITLLDKWEVPAHGFFLFVKYSGPGQTNLVNFGIKWSKAEKQVPYQCEEIASHLYLDRANSLVLVLPEKLDKDATPDTFHWIPHRRTYIPVEHLAIQEGNIVFRNYYTTTIPHGFAQQYEIGDTRYWVIQFRYDANMSLAMVSVFKSVGGISSCVYVPVKDESVVNLLRQHQHLTPDALQKLDTYAPSAMPNILMVGK